MSYVSWLLAHIMNESSCCFQNTTETQDLFVHINIYQIFLSWLLYTYVDPSLGANEAE
jgi:hypothetical protein